MGGWLWQGPQGKNKTPGCRSGATCCGSVLPTGLVLSGRLLLREPSSRRPQSSPLRWLGEGRGQPRVTGQVVFAGKPPVVECVHVDDGVGLHHEGRLGFVLRALLAGEGQPDLLGHGAAEGPLEAEEEDIPVRARLAQGQASPAPQKAHP